MSAHVRWYAVPELSVFQPSLFGSSPHPGPVIEDVRLIGAPSLVKDSLDRAGAALALVALAPLLLYLAVLVRLSGRGPLLVRQVRVGRSGRSFTLLKFRTLTWTPDADVDPEQELSPLLTRRDAGVLPLLPGNVRVTRTGRLMRLTGLDELPQLVNILLGHMSFVGPRPRLPEQAAELSRETLPILLAKPGLVGLSQVAGVRAGAERDILDVHYVRTWSFGLDLAIALRALRQLAVGPRDLRDPFDGS